MNPLPFSTLDTISSQNTFEDAVHYTLTYQYDNNSVFRAYCDLINRPPSAVTSIGNLPFLPISLFKSRRILTQEKEIEMVFRSSQTTAQAPAQHFISDLSLYQNSFRSAFKRQYGSPKDWVILALLPSYLERNDASLVYMVSDLIRQSRRTESGFYLDNFQALSDQIKQLEAQQQPTLLIGVSFALLDFATAFPQTLHYTTVMETGGMKGRKKEMVRSELHAVLKDNLGCRNIHSEYGMTELLSQAYAQFAGEFVPPPWMQVVIRDPSDPFSTLPNGQTGGLNIIDLANQNSCAFIATQDLGKQSETGNFDVLGRFDTAEIRGCNLMAGAATHHAE